MYNPSNRSVNFLKPVSVIFGCLKRSNRLSPKRRKRVRFLLSTNDEDASSEEADKLFTTHENHALVINNDKSHPVFVQDTVEIPRYTEQFVRIKLSRYLEPNDFSYLIQGHFDQSIQGIQVARAITFLEKPFTLVRVANASDQPVILRKKLRIAQVHPIQPPPPDLSPSPGSLVIIQTTLTAIQACLRQHRTEKAHWSRATTLGHGP